MSDESRLVDRLVTTYLEMQSLAEFRPKKVTSESEPDGRLWRVARIGNKDWKFNREMYFKVGEQWKWIDKRPWTDAQWQDWANHPNLRTFAGYSGDELIGYYELHRNAGEIEIAYFGLLPAFIGRGLGGALLTSAIETAWAWAPTPARVWVHTCNRDHPSALANYQARGFKTYKSVTSDV